MRDPLYPLLYQVNTRLWLTELSSSLNRPATLDDIPDASLDRFAEMGFDWVWLLSVWQTGLAGQQVSRGNTELCDEFRQTLPDLCEEDICGSGFAITGYEVHVALGGDSALERLRQRLANRDIKLMLDFVANHTALDHPWTRTHPDYYVWGTEDLLAREPRNYTRVKRDGSELILAHGRDPYLTGWPDTLQLNYGNPALQQEMIAELLKVAGQCDGVRCDMAMLLLPEVFERTWGIRAAPFWPCAIEQVCQRFPEFIFMAEVYWDLEWTLQQQGFDYTYDKRLYDRLRDGQARPVREHLAAGLDYQSKLVRFLENHDEPRAAAEFGPAVHKAAAIVTFLTPGLRFLHQGQLEGRRKRISPHLCRAPNESVDNEIQQLHEQILLLLHNSVVRGGDWQLLECIAAWEGNWTCDCFIAFAWQAPGADRLLATINYASNHSQCFVRLPFADLAGHQWRLVDLMGEDTYDRDGDDLTKRGLYLDVPPWSASVFSMTMRA